MLAVVMMVLATGCAGGSSVGQTPTATMPPLPGVTPGADVVSACAGAHGSPLHLGQTGIQTYYSWQALPSDLPLKPEPIAVARTVGTVALNTITVDVGVIPPATTAPGYLCAVTARIAAYQPLAAPIPNVTRACSDHPYLDPGGPDYGGDCGIIPGPPASAAITFASSASGTTVSIPLQNALAPSQPAAFPPPNGGSSHVWIYLKVPASGTYTFVIGLWQNQSGPTLTAAVSEEFNVDAAHEWTGQACTLPDMQAQLPPPTNPPTLVLCPGPPPPLS